MENAIWTLMTLAVIGLMGLGYYLAGRWFSGFSRWMVGFLLGVAFIGATAVVLVGGCTLVVAHRLRGF